MKKINLLSIVLVLILVSCGKKSGGGGADSGSSTNNGSTSQPVSSEEVITQQYQRVFEGFLRSKEGEMEFQGNQVRLKTWTEVHQKLSPDDQMSFVVCQIERIGSFRVVRVKDDIRFRVKIASSKVLDVKVAPRYENRMGGISQGYMLDQCEAFVKRSNQLDARLVNTSTDFIHLFHPEDYNEYDEKEVTKVFSQSDVHDYSDFYIKGEEIDYTPVFGVLYEGIYRDQRMPYKAQLGISIRGNPRELTYNVWSLKDDKVCSDLGKFKVFFSVAKGLELRLSKTSPCVLNPEKGFLISDLNRDQKSDNIFLGSPFGQYSVIYDRNRNPRR